MEGTIMDLHRMRELAKRAEAAKEMGVETPFSDEELETIKDSFRQTVLDSKELLMRVADAASINSDEIPEPLRSVITEIMIWLISGTRLEIWKKDAD
jgi:hypothetical protein